MHAYIACAFFYLVLSFQFNESTVLPVPNASALDQTKFPAWNHSKYEISQLSFLIEGCSSAQKQTLNDLFLDFPRGISLVLDDVTFGTTSTHGFTAMFKANRNINYVKYMLESVMTGRKLHGLLPNRAIDDGPRFACVSRDSRRKYSYIGIDPYLSCQGPPPNPPPAAFYVQETKLIFLCDAFWRCPDYPGHQLCPSVQNNQFVLDQPGFHSCKFYTLMHEMLHFYLGRATLSPHSWPHEQYEANALVNLFSSNSVRNPANYEFYAASQFSFDPFLHSEIFFSSYP